MKIFDYFNKPSRAAYVFLFPSLLTLLVFSFIPLGGAVFISLLNLDIYFSNTAFAGFANFLRAFTDARFWNALLNTVIFAITEVALHVGIGLLVAAAAADASFSNRFFRSIFFIPVVCSMTAIGITWSLILDGTIGLFPYLIESFFGVTSFSFFREMRTAMPTVVAMTVWKNFGYTMSVLVVGINNISRNYYEASEIDGASKIKQFFYITVPCLLPALGFCLITNIVGSLQVFDQVFVTTQGGPQFKTETLVMYIYKTGFSMSFNLGYSSAMSVLLMILIIVVSLTLYLKMFVADKDM
jgi:multiple sugar transport system permease protein